MFSRCSKCGKLYFMKKPTLKCCGRMVQRLKRKAYKELKRLNK